MQKMKAEIKQKVKWLTGDLMSPAACNWRVDAFFWPNDGYCEKLAYSIIVPHCLWAVADPV